MLHFFTVLADNVTIRINGATLSIILGAILYIIIAAIIGFIAEFIMKGQPISGYMGTIIVKGRPSFGFIGNIIAALIGIWLITQIIIIQGIGDIYIFDISLIRTLIGAIIFIIIWRIIISIVRIMLRGRILRTA